MIASPLDLILISLRGTSLALELAGRPQAGNALNALANAAQAGVNIEAHMKTVADKLADRSATELDFEDVELRIREETDAILKA